MKMKRQRGPEFVKKIHELRNDKGMSYDQIASLMRCSKATLSYYFGSGGKKAVIDRQRENRKDLGVLRARLEKWELDNDIILKKYKDVFRNNISDRKVRIEASRKYLEDTYNGKCYLSGRPFDLDDTGTFHFDHIIPESQHGTNGLENLGLCVPEANQAKSDLSVDEFLELCKDVLEHNGYSVKKS